MQSFKNWMENYDKLFNQRDISQKADIAKMLGFAKPLKKLHQGSFATLYQHPQKENLLIKITAHEEDVKNLVKAQSIKSNNVVKVFDWKKGKKIKELSEINSLAIIVEKVVGESMDYTTSDFYELSLDGNFELASEWLGSTVHKKQKLILDKYHKNNDVEHLKLAELFATLNNLEKLYRIELSDFQDNILDSGNHYVIIDMGF